MMLGNARSGVYNRSNPDDERPWLRLRLGIDTRPGMTVASIPRLIGIYWSTMSHVGQTRPLDRTRARSVNSLIADLR
jgi:hypothetical protein